jgi:hypothetical protein
MIRVLLYTIVALFLAVPLAANDFCMDCVQKAEVVGQGESEDLRITATCCMAWDGHCYPRDILIDQNVGSGCLVSEPSESGSTYCRSDHTRDKNCPSSGSGETRTKSGSLGTECVYDAYGWCDASCSRCSWG